MVVLKISFSRHKMAEEKQINDNEMLFISLQRNMHSFSFRFYWNCIEFLIYTRFLCYIFCRLICLCCTVIVLCWLFSWLDSWTSNSVLFRAKQACFQSFFPMAPYWPWKIFIFVIYFSKLFKNKLTEY